jgi:hypothetical protein
MRFRTWISPLAALLASACAPDLEDLEDEAESPISSSPPFYGDPENDAVFAVDVSHWEGPLSQREMDCFWASGVRHVVAGTQVEEVTRQQLAMAVARGMTVDAYVYLYLGGDVAAQVDLAFDRASGFPIQRMWLDVEEAPRGVGPTALADRVQAALDRCRAHGGASCGIYTGPGFWKSFMADTPRFAEVPLWYARYNRERTLSRWPAERFGGWSSPVAKQWAEEALCGVGVDKDTMQVEGPPAIEVDRASPPPPEAPPPAPAGLHPEDGSLVTIDVVKLMTELVPGATRYELALEVLRGSRFVPYYTWRSVDGFRRTYPPRNTVYRFRARASNAHGLGPWSEWSQFSYGTRAPPP